MKKWGIGILGMVAVTISVGSFFLYSNFTKAESKSVESDLIVNVGSVLSLAVYNCGTVYNGVNSEELILTVNPTPSGTFKSDCQNVVVDTNAPGYSLSAKANSVHPAINSGNPVNQLIYQNPLPPNLSVPPTIIPVTHTMSVPGTVTPNYWGFAVTSTTASLVGTPSANFTGSYVVDNASNIYAQMPVTDTTMYSTNNPQSASDYFKFWYAVNLNHSMLAGKYQTTVTYTATANEIPPPPVTCKNFGPECMAFTINATSGTYSIPTSGYVTGSYNHTYDWDIYIDGYAFNACGGSNNCTGTGSQTSAGIVLSGLTNGQRKLLIVPHNTPAPGWGNAFGYNWQAGTGASTSTNSNRLISIDRPLTTMAFAPKTSESTTNASYMFANIFGNCRNLTTGVSIIDTYKLPNTITDMSWFLSGTHMHDIQLASSINLDGISGWLSNNNSIINLSYFLQNAQYVSTGNFVTDPINLSPLSGWFINNTSVTDMSWFLFGVHEFNGNLLSSVILPTWSFTNVTNLYGFLGNTHRANDKITNPINLTPLTNWFHNNSTVTDLSYFLSGVHESGDFYNYPTANALLNPIDLSPISGWFSANNSVTDLGGFLQNAHSGNYKLNTPINLSPLSGWFNNNTSITSLSHFMSCTHERSQLTSPINLTSLSNWFGQNRSFNYIQHFLSRTHYQNPNIVLNNQIIFPNWLKTIRGTSGTILNDNNNVFSNTFGLSVPQSGDIGEPKYQDGTVLSSIGNPLYRRYTYQNRTAIEALVTANWK